MKRKFRLGTALRRVYAHLGKAAPLYWLCVTLWASQDFLGNYIMALFTRNLVAAVTEGTGIGVAFHAIGLYVGMQLAYMVVFLLGISGIARWGLLMRSGLESDLLDRLLRAAEPRPSGQRVSLFVHDTEQVNALATQHIGSIWMGVIALVGSAAVVAWVDPKLCGLALCGGLVFLLSDMLFVRPNRRLGAQIQAEKAVANGRLNDLITGSLTIRLLGLAETLCGEHSRALAGIRRLELARAQFQCGKTAVDTWRGWIISVGILGIGCLEVSRGTYSLADLMLTSAMVGQLLYKFTLIGWSIVGMQQSVAATERVMQALDAPLEALRPHGRPVKPQGETALSMERVTFFYPEDRGAPALQDVSLTLRRGETVAMVGASGSGKSTVFRLLLGMLTPQAGNVRLWDVPCAEASLSDWRGQLAYVAQEAPLFDGTIAQNIAWGAPGVDARGVADAAEAANALAFIQKRPEGLDARVGAGSTLLSGGERQRVVVARAFARNAPILLLDEATSALDAEAEAAVQAALDRLLAGRAALIAAHRLSTICHADRILVFEGGRIVEEGCHEALLRRGGVYHRLWMAQWQAREG